MKGLAWVEDAFEVVQEVGAKGVEAVEDGACDVWKAVIPPPVQNALKLTQQQPWRGLWRGFNLTAPTLVQFALPPVTFPLAILFFPILIWLETTRLAFAIFANCGRVTTTLQREAQDLILVLDQLAPNKPVGMAVRTTLSLAGQSGVVASYDQFYPKVRALLNPISRKQPLSANAVLSFAVASAQMSGDARVIGMATQSEAQLALLEEKAVQVLGDQNTLGSNPVITKSTTSKSTPAKSSSSTRSKEGRRTASRAAAAARQAARVAADPAKEASREASREATREAARLRAMERANERALATRGTSGGGGLAFAAVGGLGLLFYLMSKKGK